MAGVLSGDGFSGGGVRFDSGDEKERLEGFVVEAVPAGEELSFHREGSEKIGGLVSDCSYEVRRGYSDEGVGMAVHVDGLT